MDIVMVKDQKGLVYGKLKLLKIFLFSQLQVWSDSACLDLWVSLATASKFETPVKSKFYSRLLSG